MTFSDVLFAGLKMPPIQWQKSLWRVTNYQVYFILGRYLKPKSILEIGTLAGCSLISLVLGAGTVERVISLDSENDYPGSQEIARQNLFAVGFKGSAEFFVGDSIKDFPEITEPVDLVHVDGEHHGEYPLSDMRNGWKVLKNGGYMLIHDVLNQATPVQEALKDFLKGRDDVQFMRVIPSFCGLALLKKRRQIVRPNLENLNADSRPFNNQKN